MIRYAAIFCLLLSMTAGVSTAADEHLAIEEGFFIDGLDGLLKKAPGVDVWSFTCDSDIKMTEKRQVPAGEPIQILPCSVLEQMSKLAGDERRLRVRLSALFTEYKHMNYLYAVYFLPLAEDGQVAEIEPQEQPDTQEGKSQADSGREDSIIPQEILSQIRKNEAPDLEKFQQIAAVTGDMNMIDRTGYLRYENHVHSFQLDAFGMNKGRQNVLLLPNHVLEEIRKRLARTPGRQRYMVSGLVTVYKGKTYMLVRRAVRTYTQGNFTQ